MPKALSSVKSRAKSKPDATRRRTGSTPAPGKAVGAVAGAIKILRYLAESRSPVGVSKIAKDTKLNTSTSFNILRTLAAYDFVHFDSITKSYSLSLGIMEIAKGATAIGGDMGTLRPMMDRIAHDHAVTVTLWQPVSQNRKVLIQSALTRKAVSIQMAVGQRLPIFIGATGRIFAAYRNGTKGELKAAFDEIRWDGPLTFSAFLDQVTETRTKGWAMDDGNFATGTYSVAVPILDQSEVAVLAVTATMFTGQYSEERALKIVRDLQQFATQASRIAAS